MSCSLEISDRHHPQKTQTLNRQIVNMINIPRRACGCQDVLSAFLHSSCSTPNDGVPFLCVQTMKTVHHNSHCSVEFFFLGGGYCTYMHIDSSSAFSNLHTARMCKSVWADVLALTIGKVHNAVWVIPCLLLFYTRKSAAAKGLVGCLLTI